jgi:hypothetical protein
MPIISHLPLRSAPAVTLNAANVSLHNFTLLGIFYLICKANGLMIMLSYKAVNFLRPDVILSACLDRIFVIALGKNLFTSEY